MCAWIMLSHTALSVPIPQRRSLVSKGLTALRGSADLSSKIIHNLNPFDFFSESEGSKSQVHLKNEGQIPKFKITSETRLCFKASDMEQQFSKVVPNYRLCKFLAATQ